MSINAHYYWDYLISWDPCGGCLHGGTCIEFARKCLCIPSYYGDLCDKRNPCPSYPIGSPDPNNECGGCKNGGVCFETIGMCICHESFFGEHCEGSYVTSAVKTVKHEGCKRYCETDEQCLNGGRCQETAKCQCNEGYFGKNCELREEWWKDSEEPPDTDTVGVILASVPAVLITTVILPAAACFYCVVLRRSTNSGSVINEDITENSEDDIINVDAANFSRHSFTEFDEGEINESTRIAEGMPPMYGSQSDGNATESHLRIGDDVTHTIQRVNMMASPPSYDRVNVSPPEYGGETDLPPPYQSRINTPSSDITPPPPYEE
uniref:Uncharacterized protein LOC102807779 n=1 Tax=Saccoglossus kowalevskii TaxID=10224 RepID=A0ABM0MRB1_SACKO|nr:PREDICTED: uncharacterized protein LOC102807779 [Saccoglossus kowalevskii]